MNCWQKSKSIWNGICQKFPRYFSQVCCSLLEKGNWDWIQFEELKCLHTKELIFRQEAYSSQKEGPFQNCQQYISVAKFLSRKKLVFQADKNQLLNHAKTNLKLINHQQQLLQNSPKNYLWTKNVPISAWKRIFLIIF